MKRRCRNMPSGLTVADFPEMLKLWSPRNSVSPAEVTYRNNSKYWWIDDRGHEWETATQTIYDLLEKGNSGCPRCNYSSGVMVSDIPEMLSLWGSNTMDPSSVAVSSTKKYRWVDNLGHAWDSTAYSIKRSLESFKTGCPICAGRLVGQTLADYPEASQFDIEKNYPKTPGDFSAGTKTKVWWKCGSGHSWMAAVGTRVRQGSGCPTCYKLSRSKQYKKPRFDSAGVKGSSAKSPRRSTRGGSSFDIGPHRPNPVRRNVDARLREAQRGDSNEDKARYLAELVRAGRLEDAAVRLAAEAGYAPARLLHTVPKRKWVTRGGRVRLIEGLEALRGRNAVILFACDMAEHAIAVDEAIRNQEEDTRARELVSVVRAFLTGRASLEELQEVRESLENAWEELVLGIDLWARNIAYVAATAGYPYTAQTASNTASEMANASGNSKEAYEQQRELFIRYVLGAI